ncbi:MAG: FMN-binding protein, partial [Proteobacteria bacterium]|nr:FMN-binding protein [Pseudomonadota bacterium]
KVTEVIPGRIVSEQSTVVDAVTGATNSSRVIMNAVQRAVEKAYK